MKYKMSKKVLEKFETYPGNIKKKLLKIRELIYETAHEDGISDLEEDLKWGEPAYITKKGSTIRIDWKPKLPEQYAIYFHCQTKLLDTFRELYPDAFNYDGNRAIILDKNTEIPVDALKHCLSMSLNYHKLKHLPMLGGGLTYE